MALATTWRSLHPRARERFHEAPAPPAVRRLYYATSDGWQAPLFHLAPCPTGAGEPVLLLHGLALGPGSARYGRGPTLASSLTEAGFAVYCASHRGDRDAIGTGEVHLDAVLARDLPAALAAIREDSGFARVHVVGHGLGGQLALLLGELDEVATVTALAAPVRFARPRSPTLRVHRALGLLPPSWHLPTRTLAQLAAPWLDDPGALGASHAPAPRVRGALHHTAEDVAVGIVEQVARWIDEDSLTTRDGLRDYVEAFGRARAPLHLVHAPGDRLAHPDSPAAVRARWGAECRVHSLPESLARLDCLLAAEAPTQVFAPVLAWLEERRRRAW